MQKLLISVVSGTYNRLSLLQNMVASVRADIPTGMPYEIILVDGGSTDGTLDWCKAQPDVRLIEHGELRGAIDAFTDGARAAVGQYVVLLNDDVEVVGGTLVSALVYLEENRSCGAVAFADNRPTPYYAPGSYHVLQMPARLPNGVSRYVNYAQCGMFRRTLGDAVNWWRGLAEQGFSARTYAGDNLLSANLWRMGYTVDALPECRVNDFVHDDALRQINTEGAAPETGTHPDSEAYYRLFPQGVPLNSAERVDMVDKRQLRILYLPIYEPGWTIQKQQKKGLREALGKAGIVYEVDYLGIPRETLQKELARVIDRFKPDMILSQIHAPEPLTVEMLTALRTYYPRAVWVNWNGDYWPDGLTSGKMLHLLKHVDLQLVINGSVISAYQEHGIPAAYWQIGYEEPGDDLPEAEAHEVVFLGNAYHPERKRWMAQLRNCVDSIALYGDGWGMFGAGNTLYDFAAGKAIYRAAKIALGDNQYLDAYGFVSNRLFQALAAGGCLLLHQTVPGLEELTGLKDGVHYVSWTDVDDLAAKVNYYLKDEKARAKIATAGTAYVRKHHSFEARVIELFDKLLPLAKRMVQPTVMLRFLGRAETGGVKGRYTNHQYTFHRGTPLIVDKMDAPYMVASGEWEML